jgi:hypothetical protein
LFILETAAHSALERAEEKQKPETLQVSNPSGDQEENLPLIVVLCLCVSTAFLGLWARMQF